MNAIDSRSKRINKERPAERNNYYQAGDKQRPRAQQQNYQRTNAAKGKTLKIDPKANDNTQKQLTVPKSDPASN